MRYLCMYSLREDLNFQFYTFMGLIHKVAPESHVLAGISTLALLCVTNGALVQICSKWLG